MKTRARRLVVNALEWVCGRLDCIPTFHRGDDGKIHRGYGYFGCYLTRFSSIAVRLDDRWGTGVWGPPEPDNGADA